MLKYEILVTEPTRDVKIENLIPRTPYYIKLRAKDSKGYGKVGMPIKVTTRHPGKIHLLIAICNVSLDYFKLQNLFTLMKSYIGVIFFCVLRGKFFFL